MHLTLSSVLILVLTLLLLAVIPVWPHSSRWGFGPSGALAAILLIVFVLMFAGQIPHIEI